MYHVLIYEWASEDEETTDILGIYTDPEEAAAAYRKRREIEREYCRDELVFDTVSEGAESICMYNDGEYNCGHMNLYIKHHAIADNYS